MLPSLALLTLLASSTSASTVILRSADVLSRPYASILADLSSSSSPQTETSEIDSILPRQQDAPITDSSKTSAVKVNPDGTLNMTAWNTATDKACMDALSLLSQSTNPSGNCICYNLPSLDADGGVFEAELRLYKVSTPREEFTDVKPEDVGVKVLYASADVSMINSNGTGSLGANGTADGVDLGKRADDGPTLLKTYMLVGKIHSDKMASNLSIAELETLLMPILALTGPPSSSSSTPITTTVSANEASFLTGVFSQSIVMSDFASAQAAVTSAVAGLKTGDTQFVLPGRQMLIFPTGLIITGSWALVGIIAYGFGTYERMKYAQLYKRRSLADRKKTSPAPW